MWSQLTNPKEPSMLDPQPPPPPKPWPQVMQDLNLQVDQQQVVLEIFDCLGRVPGLISGCPMRSECEHLTRTVYTDVSWQAICYWFLEKGFPGEPTLGDHLQEGVELVRSGRASVEHVAQALLLLAYT